MLNILLAETCVSELTNVPNLSCPPPSPRLHNWVPTPRAMNVKFVSVGLCGASEHHSKRTLWKMAPKATNVFAFEFDAHDFETKSVGVNPLEIIENKRFGKKQPETQTFAAIEFDVHNFETKVVGIRHLGNHSKDMF